MPDQIHIEGLQTAVRIGVPDAERAEWQTLEIDAVLTPRADFTNLEDSLERTVDYAQVCLDIRQLAASEPRRLLETLGDELAHALLDRYPLSEVSLTLRKFIVPGTRAVGVSLTRPLRERIS